MQNALRKERENKMNANGYSINHEDKIITVCAACFPSTTVLAAHRELAALSYYDFSHGYCKPCATAMKVAAVKMMLQRGGALQTVNA